jgi:hypothetical protein
VAVVADPELKDASLEDMKFGYVVTASADIYPLNFGRKMTKSFC